MTLNVYQRFPDEFRRVIGLVELFRSNEARIYLMQRYRGRVRAHELATALGLEPHRSSFTQSQRIWLYVRNNTVTEPFLPAEPPPEIKPPDGPCDGCGGIGESKGLRWAKVADGKPVTVSIDWKGLPDTLSWLDAETIEREWFKPWTVDTSIRFKFLRRGKGDIHIVFKPIDGPGKTRGFAWQPANDAKTMEEGGDLSGDMTIDSIDRWRSHDDLHETGEHEVGHSIGLPHTDNPDDVMYPYVTGNRKKHSKNDIRAKTERYPVKQALEKAA